jgi:hypothetical protein
LTRINATNKDAQIPAIDANMNISFSTDIIVENGVGGQIVIAQSFAPKTRFVD